MQSKQWVHGTSPAVRAIFALLSSEKARGAGAPCCTLRARLDLPFAAATHRDVRRRRREVVLRRALADPVDEDAAALWTVGVGGGCRGGGGWRAKEGEGGV
jgi:hypothetical protein